MGFWLWQSSIGQASPSMSDADIDCFCAHYELQRQLKRITVKGRTKEEQFAICTFYAQADFRRASKRYLIAYAQRNRWSNDWYRYWFYVRTPRFTIKEENGEDAYWFPPASKMEEMNPRLGLRPRRPIEGRLARWPSRIQQTVHHDGGS